jgi:hypothetical protein
VDGLFNRPGGHAVLLSRQPVLASPDAGDQPWQPPLGVYLEELEADLAWTPRGEHLALELDVALPASMPLLSRGHDLDDYLVPVVDRLGVIRFDAVFATKRRGVRSSIRLGPATPAGEPPPPPQVSVRTTASATSIDWKQQLNGACAAVTTAPAPVGGVAVELRFSVSRRRNWSALWKPAIDSLGPILGVPDPTRPYRADVARITTLALHRRFDDTLGHRVQVEVWWHRDG